MKSVLTIAASVLVTTTSAHAQPAPAPSTDHESHHTGPASAAGQEERWTQGEVRKVDLENGKLTLRHGPIRNLDMPGMTMVFKMFDLPTRHLTLSRLTKSKTAPRRRRLSSHACV